MKVTHALLLRARDLAGPRAEASAELIRPLVGCLEDDAPAFPPHQDLALTCKSALFGEANGLTPTVLKEFCPSRFHDGSLDASLDMVKLVALLSSVGPPNARAQRPRCEHRERSVRWSGKFDAPIDGRALIL